MAETVLKEARAAAPAMEAGDFAQLLQKEFKPKTEEAKSAVAQAVPGNIVPDFPLINKSFNLCYACCDK